MIHFAILLVSIEKGFDFNSNPFWKIEFDFYTFGFLCTKQARMQFDKEALQKVIPDVRKELETLKVRRQLPPPIRRQKARMDVQWLINNPPDSGCDIEAHEEQINALIQEYAKEDAENTKANESYYAMLDEQIRLKEYELHILESLLQSSS